MNKFENATRGKVRWSTGKGLLTVEDLWDLSLAQLNSLAKNLNREIKVQSEEDYLNEVSVEDNLTKLKFDIVLEILNTKKAEYKAMQEAAADKAYNNKIMAIIAKKQDEDLENMSIDQLNALLKKASE